MRVVIAIFSLFLVLSTSALAQQTTQPYYPHMWGGGYGWFMGPFMMLLFIAVAVTIVILLVRGLSGSGQGPAAQPYAQPGKTPMDILKERFAKGEIDKEEFEERRKILE